MTLIIRVFLGFVSACLALAMWVSGGGQIPGFMIHPLQPSDEIGTFEGLQRGLAEQVEAPDNEFEQDMQERQDEAQRIFEEREQDN